MHPLDFFQVKTTLKRTRIDNETGNEYVSYTYIKDAKTAEYCHDLQSPTVKFELNTHKEDDPFVSDAPIIRLHDSGLKNMCTSCEA